MRVLTAFVLMSMLPALVSARADGEPPRSCPFKDMDQVAVTGLARRITSGAQEPGESINTYFDLETSGPPCGRQTISVFAPGIIACLEGDKVTVRGVYYAPGEVPFDRPMIDLAAVTCARNPR
jgi:hypothetical protein